VKILNPSSIQEIEPHQPVVQFEIGTFKNFIYLILDWSSFEAAIIDPQKDLSEPLRVLETYGFTLKKILLTHTHWDHIGGVPELLDRFPEVQLCVHAQEAQRLKLSTEFSKSQNRIHFIQEGEKLFIGKLAVHVLHTPGHSAGECCFFLDNIEPPHLFTGDTLFIRDCGRTDLESGNTAEMFDSLQKIKNLPLNTLILPGHHYTIECISILQKELETSPPLKCQSIQELEQLP